MNLLIAYELLIAAVIKGDNMHKRCVRRSAVIASVFVVLALVFAVGVSPAYADLTLTKILDFDAVLPGQTLPINGSSDNKPRFAQLVDGNIAFSTNRGIYKVVDGQVSLVVDGGTSIPGGDGMFPAILNYSFDGRDVVFHADGVGVYSDSGGALTSLVDNNTTIPGTADTFDAWRSVQFNRSAFAFVGMNSGTKYGVYRYGRDGLSVVADTNTAVPGEEGLFTSFGISSGSLYRKQSDSFRGDTFAFEGWSSTGGSGLYTWRDGQLEVVIDSNDVLPGLGYNYDRADSYSIDGDTVAFIGQTGELSTGRRLEGVYRSDDGEVSLIADRETLLPGSDELLGSFNFPIVDDNTVYFTGAAYWGGKFDGFYMHNDSTLSTIVDLNTNVPGSDGQFEFVAQLFTDNGDVVFTGRAHGAVKGGVFFKPLNQPIVKLADGYLDYADMANSQILLQMDDGYYIATIPEPGGLVVLALAGIVGVRHRCH